MSFNPVQHILHFNYRLNINNIDYYTNTASYNILKDFYEMKFKDVNNNSYQLNISSLELSRIQSIAELEVLLCNKISQIVGNTAATYTIYPSHYNAVDDLKAQDITFYNCNLSLYVFTNHSNITLTPNNITVEICRCDNSQVVTTLYLSYSTLYGLSNYSELRDLLRTTLENKLGSTTSSTSSVSSGSIYIGSGTYSMPSDDTIGNKKTSNTSNKKDCYNHSWKTYTGLFETFEYCEHCDEKRV